jgi:DNA-binding response OmpR family regulator
MAGRILVVDDELPIVELLSYNLKRANYEVLIARDGEEALRVAREEQPDLVILDLMLPKLDGLEVCRALRRERDIPIIMLTARDTEVDRVVGLELGADDYVVKPFSLRELTSRIRALLRRSYGDLAIRGSAGRVRFGDVEIDLERLLVRRAGRPVDLTPTEFRLLRYLVAHPGRPTSRQALIEAVWGYESEIGYERTVDVHVRHLRQKLEPDPAQPRYLVTVRGAGYKFEP